MPNAVLQRYSTEYSDTCLIWTSPEHLAKMTDLNLWDGFGPKRIALIHSTVRTGGNLEAVTLMPFASISVLL